MSAIYSRTLFKADVLAKVSAVFSDANFNTIANTAVQEVISDADLKSTIRRSALSPNLFDDVFQYTCPADVKDDKITDLKPQIQRGRFDYWRLTSPVEFDRYKENQRNDQWGDPVNVSAGKDWMGENLIAIDTRDFVRKLLVSRPIEDHEVVIDALDSVGTWLVFGDGTNLTADTDDFVKGSGSLNWDISATGGTTAGIYNASLTTFDVSDFKSTGSVFVWAYITSVTNLTNYILRVGSSSSAYYSITITTNSEGNSLEAGWNLLRFDFTNKSTTGTPDDDACVYVALYMTKAAGKVSETDYRFDNLVMKRGDHYNLYFYSKYGWQTSAAVYLENATADTDLLNADTTEYRLFVLKACQLIEEHLRNWNEATAFENQYNKKLSKYIFDNPSLALCMVETYRDLNN